MPRVKGDRPDVVPAGAKNFAFIGQFCEIPDDVVFTVEYSVRSAQMAVYKLLDIKKEIPPVFKGQHDVGVLITHSKRCIGSRRRSPDGRFSVICVEWSLNNEKSLNLIQNLRNRLWFSEAFNPSDCSYLICIKYQ